MNHLCLLEMENVMREIYLRQNWSDWSQLLILQSKKYGYLIFYLFFSVNDKYILISLWKWKSSYKYALITQFLPPFSCLSSLKLFLTVPRQSGILKEPFWSSNCTEFQVADMSEIKNGSSD